jgi:hypothetical protein
VGSPDGDTVAVLSRVGGEFGSGGSELLELGPLAERDDDVGELVWVMAHRRPDRPWAPAGLLESARSP